VHDAYCILKFYKVKQQLQSLTGPENGKTAVQPNLGQTKLLQGCEQAARYSA
jgi:hypothetical protein